MKKAFAITALLLMLTIILTGCGSKPARTSADTLAGSYRLTDTAGEGAWEVYEIRDGIRLLINDDNTAVLSLMTDSYALRFDTQKKVCTSDDSQQVPYTFDGSRLVMETDAFRMVFERE